MNPELAAGARLPDHTRYRVALISLITAIILIAGLALAGAGIAILALTAVHDESDPPNAFSIGEPIETSFGSITFQNVATIGGLTSGDLGGMTHGIAGLVLQDEAQVVVSILLVNEGDAPVRVDPGQFQLTVEGTSNPLSPAGSTTHPLALLPGSSVEASLAFVVPQGGARISVGYADPGGAAITVPGGVLGQAPPADGDGHSH